MSTTIWVSLIWLVLGCSAALRVTPQPRCSALRCWLMSVGTRLVLIRERSWPFVLSMQFEVHISMGGGGFGKVTPKKMWVLDGCIGIWLKLCCLTFQRDIPCLHWAKSRHRVIDLTLVVIDFSFMICVNRSSLR